MPRCTEWRGEHAAVVDNHVNYIDKLALYEDKDEKGLLYLLPAPLGTTVYEVHDRCRPGWLVCPFDGGYGIERCNHDNKTYQHCNAYYEPTTLTIENVHRFGRNLFLTADVASRIVERMNSK